MIESDQTTIRPRHWPAMAAVFLSAVGYFIAAVLLLGHARLGEIEPVLYARMLSTGHMAEFIQTTEHRDPPVDQWVRADQWQRYERLENRGIYRQIEQESGRYEAHPPFFFWLMHAALSLGVSDHWVTTVLNLPATLVLSLLVAGMTGWLTRDGWSATLAGTCLLLSGPMLLVADSSRSPIYFVPFTLLMIWLVLDWAKRPRGRVGWRVAATVALCVLGMLNHYEMVLVIVGCGIFLLCRDRRAFGLFFLGSVIAAGVFLAIDPYCLGSVAFNAKVNANEPLTPLAFTLRFVRVFIGFFHFLAMEPKWTRVFTLVIPATIVGAWLWNRKQRSVALPGDATPRHPLGDLGLVTLCVVGLSSVLVVAYVLPRHGYGVLNCPGLMVLTPVWLAIGLRQVVRSAAVSGALVLVLLIASVGTFWRQLGLYADAAGAIHAISTADVLCTDNLGIHGVPRFVDSARPDAWVLVTTRDRLADAAGPAVRNGCHVVIALDRDFDTSKPDPIQPYLQPAVANGTLRAIGGLEPFSPEFSLYTTPYAHEYAAYAGSAPRVTD